MRVGSQSRDPKSHIAISPRTTAADPLPEAIRSETVGIVSSSEMIVRREPNLPTQPCHPASTHRSNCSPIQHRHRALLYIAGPKSGAHGSPTRINDGDPKGTAYLALQSRVTIDLASPASCHGHGTPLMARGPSPVSIAALSEPHDESGLHWQILYTSANAANALTLHASHEGLPWASTTPQGRALRRFGPHVGPNGALHSSSSFLNRLPQISPSAVTDAIPCHDCKKVEGASCRLWMMVEGHQTNSGHPSELPPIWRLSSMGASWLDSGIGLRGGEAPTTLP